MSENEKPLLDGPGPQGFRAGGVSAGIKGGEALDLGAILSDRPAVAAGTTTTNLFCSAPVIVCRERLEAAPRLRGVIVNSGVSNACTGEPGLKNAYLMTGAAEKACGVEAGEFLVASTGVIGAPLPIDKITEATPRLIEGLSADGWESFARAIMTTDLVPKVSRRTFKVRHGLTRGTEVTVIGVAKGSGMIHPNMATMLSFIATDYALGPSQARAMLRRVVNHSYNCLTVDGDTSTSDTVILMANGAALARSQSDDASDAKFEKALLEVATDLSKAIARDGEGATKLVTIDIAGAASDAAARKVALSIANSPLVKTALFGNDPNWGRICCAAGYAGVPFDTNDFMLKLQGKPVMKRGMPVAFEKAALSAALKAPEVTIEAKIGGGDGTARVWTCDLSYDYVKINADYTT